MLTERILSSGTGRILIVRSGDRWQASVEVDGAYSVGIASGPLEALSKALVGHKPPAITALLPRPPTVAVGSLLPLLPIRS